MLLDNKQACHHLLTGTQFPHVDNQQEHELHTPSSAGHNQNAVQKMEPNWTLQTKSIVPANKAMKQN